MKHEISEAIKNGTETIFRTVMNQEEVKAHPLCFASGDPESQRSDSFYGWLLKATGLSANEQFDCRYIDVATDIEDAWFEYAERFGIRPYEMAMQCALMGPKRDSSLAAGTVVIYAGGISA